MTQLSAISYQPFALSRGAGESTQNECEITQQASDSRWLIAESGQLFHVVGTDAFLVAEAGELDESDEVGYLVVF